MKNFLKLLLSTAFLFNSSAALALSPLDKQDLAVKILNDNPGFEAALTATQCSTYSDAAAASPVDGTGGSPNVTAVRSTGSPLDGSASLVFTKDAVNRQGQGFSCLVNIPPAYRGHPVQIELDYSVSSGTYSGGSDSTDSDVVLYAYDITNSLLTEPSGKKLNVSSSISFPQKATFQTSTTGTQYRIIGHVATTSASAYTLKLDNLRLIRQVTSVGAALTDWKTYSATIGASTTPPTKGTNTRDRAQWRRVGDSMEISWEYVQTGAGSDGSGDYLFPLPSGYTVDTDKLSADSAYPKGACGTFDINTSGSNYLGHAMVRNSTNLWAVVNNSASASGILHAWGSAELPFSNATYQITLHCKVPIVGWTSNVQVSSETDTRVVAAKYNRTTNQSAVNGDIVDFATKVHDSHNAVTTGAAWKYTAQIPGVYEVTGAIRYDTVAKRTELYKNGVSQNVLCEYVTSETGTFSSQIELNAGDYIDIRVQGNVGTATIIGNFTHVNIKRMSGPSQIQASEKIAAKYSTNAGLTVPNNTETVVVYEDLESDTHGSYNTSTGVFTCKDPSTLFVRANAAFVAGTDWGATEYAQLTIQKNSVDNIRQRETQTASHVTAEVEVEVSGLVSCVSGDTVRVRILQNQGASTTLKTSGIDNTLSIFRVGN